MKTKDFETFEHGADIGIRGYGKTLKEAFSHALKALFSLVVEEIKWEELKAVKSFNIEIEAEFLDELFVMFINKALSLFYLKSVIFTEFKGVILSEKKGYNLKGNLMGDLYDSEKFGFGVEVKGATFTMAEVKKEGDLWIAQCVVDV